MEWIIFICSALAIIVFGITIFRRNSDRSRVDDAIDRERELQGEIQDTGRELSEDVGSARDRTSERFDSARDEVQSENSITEDSIRSTDSLIDKIKKRNSL